MKCIANDNIVYFNGVAKLSFAEFIFPQLHE